MIGSMIRRVFTILSALSLLLCIIVGIAGLRSYDARKGAYIHTRRPGRDFDIKLICGQIRFVLGDPIASSMPKRFNVTKGWTYTLKDERPWWQRNVDLHYDTRNSGYGVLSA